ncbi:secondary thiamine-phosphate synthase enzyme YjbQ [Massilia sp. GCM10023247]|uniref:secondary thiamine-phosphate synthase enzyme YjbQ n=1 Tax=Massilia sp. GCM10023247 TaxID=3252643 RepID=UPI0036101BE2
MAHQAILTFSTPGRGTQDITAEVARVVGASGVDCGLVQVFVQHTSCSLTITENADPDVRRDLDTVLARLAPDGDPAYRHDDEGPDDMAAHVRNVLTDTGITVPVGGGRLLLGTWQGIYLWEHRTAPHRRRVVVTVIG